jgi:predicted nucleotidyltransferase
MTQRTVVEKFTAALDALVDDLKKDRSVLAAILCGSLSHDTVWEKSDIDLALVTIDDSKSLQGDRTINADGVNVHAFLVPRAKFRTLVEGSLRNSFMHSLLAKGRLLYTHDDTITGLVERLHSIGQRDTEVQLLNAGTAALSTIHKAHKWLITRGDLDYSALWILYSATPLAQIEVMGRRLLADREVILQAMKLNPEFFEIVYADLLNSKKTRKSVEAALAAVDTYMADRAPSIFAPVIEHLREVEETRSCTEINDYFNKTFGVEHVTPICEYLADQGLIGKASTAVQLTKRSTMEVQELAFYSLSSR